MSASKNSQSLVESCTLPQQIIINIVALAMQEQPVLALHYSIICTWLLTICRSVLWKKISVYGDRHPARVRLWLNNHLHLLSFPKQIFINLYSQLSSEGIFLQHLLAVLCNIDTIFLWGIDFWWLESYRRLVDELTRLDFSTLGFINCWWWYQTLVQFLTCSPHIQHIHFHGAKFFGGYLPQRCNTIPYTSYIQSLSFRDSVSSLPSAESLLMDTMLFWISKSVWKDPFPCLTALSANLSDDDTLALDCVLFTVSSTLKDFQWTLPTGK